MRALPGRSSRSTLAEPSAAVTRQSSHRAQRSRIRRATGELLAKRGYASVTVELIVKRARVSFKTFYSHYANKEEVFLDLFDTAFERLQAEIEEQLAARPQAPWPEQVAIALRVFFVSITADPLIARACLVEAPTAGPLLFERYARATTAFVPLLAEGRKLSPIGAELPDTLEDTLSGSVLWSAYQRLILGEPERLEALLPETLELVIRPYVGERAAALADESIAALEPA
jgi:AcrR family transcriptional regulator